MTEDTLPAPLALSQQIAALYGSLPQVEAVALAGSHTTGQAGPSSDIDLYVYLRQELPVDVRAGMIKARAERMEVNNQFWEPGDEWIEAESHIAVDVMYRGRSWIEDQLDRVLIRHEASVGYSTCFWYNVLTSHVLYDRNGWYHAVQERARQPYPEPLRRAIIAKNHTLLRETISSYLHQVEKAAARGDLVSVNHRVAALLASYFDILFAVNRMPHPGEKRLIEIAQMQCAKRPEGMCEQVSGLIRASGVGDQDVIARIEALVEGLDGLLKAEELLPVRKS
jgi:predicted nucleotidyltransferase